MCSRYSLTSPPEAVRRVFGLKPEIDFPPRYNIAPAEPVLIVRESERGGREPVLVRWGLIPPWVKDPREFAALINARAETAVEKPSFRGAMRHRRCLVPADGFYEWTGKAGAKIPHLVRLQSHELFGIAGLWEHWLGADGSELESMAILTTQANADMAAIHDRMPVLIGPADFNRWLDCKPGTTGQVLDLLKAPALGAIEIVQVSPKVNNPRSEGPDLHVPVRTTLL